MATRPFPTPRSRPLALGPALALALLLLLAQHWGLVHGLGHSLAGRDAAVLSAAAGHAPPAVAAAVAGAVRDAAVTPSFPAPAPRADAPAPATGLDTPADPAADALCGICLVLATIGALAPPQPLAFAAEPTPATAPVAPPWPARRSAAAAPFQARAPPALPVSV